MKGFHYQIRFQCFVFLKEQPSSAGQKILNILCLLSPHLYSLVHQGKRFADFAVCLECKTVDSVFLLAIQMDMDMDITVTTKYMHVLAR